MDNISHILSIDQGTTSSRAIVFDHHSRIVADAQREFEQFYPNEGWVEHDPEEIWESTLTVSRAAVKKAEALDAKVEAIGVTNQRETVVVWDRKTGVPIYNAIVWQDRRTADVCGKMKKDGLEKTVREKTGLLLDPYFSASKIAWILDNVEGARARAQAGELACGTIDCFLIWRLTGGKVHATDVTNASRTSLFNIRSLTWDDELLSMFRVPASLLPEVKQCADDFGQSESDIFGRSIPICGVIGDQQSAAFGQAGFEAGAIKSTYGTGCFVLANTGQDLLFSDNNLLTTIAYGINGKISYAIEGSIFIAGAAVQWLRDELQIIGHASETEALAQSIKDNQGVYLVPAFAGLGAPHWRADARGAVFGLTRGTGKAALARAALECVAYQTLDLMKAMDADGVASHTLKVDGGMVKNDWMVQFLADILQTPVERPMVMETTALGAAYMAGLQSGIYRDLDEITALWKLDMRFEARMDLVQRDGLVAGWQQAVRRTLTD